MKQNVISAPMPTVNLSINKSRIKLYNKNEAIPVYYLKKDSEFQLELFNPTSDTILAKIYLNNRMISQGGLVIRPGERVFLERYFDIPSKFKFDTYEVANSEAVKKAIQDNGDVKVEFYREYKSLPYYGYSGTLTLQGNVGSRTYTTCNLGNNVTFTNNCCTGSATNINLSQSNHSALYSCDVGDVSAASATMDMLADDTDIKQPRLKSLRKLSKSIETGRVEVGSQSNQKFETVHKTFEWSAFHIVEYKLLPISQKISTTNDMKIKQYCASCGAKLKPEFKVCPYCGQKQ